MKINLPDGLASSLEAAVRDGHFPSLDEEVAEAVRRLLRDLALQKHRPVVSPGVVSPDPIIGSMRDAADELDAVVELAMKRRQEQRRDIAGE